MKKFQPILILLTCIAVMAVAAVQLNGTLFGYKMTEEAETTPTKEIDTDATSDSTSTATLQADSTLVIHTKDLCADIKGYNGTTPLDIYVKDGVVTNINALPNDETPNFFANAVKLLDHYKGKSPQEGLKMKVDVVSGATYSSKALIQNMQAGLQKAVECTGGDEGQNTEKSSLFDDWGTTLKFFIGLLVVLSAAILPLLFKNKVMRGIQLVLNVAVLGFWCGTFLNFSLFIRMLSVGTTWLELIPIIMLITAFIYPLFGQKGHYCAHVCPFGSAQELAGKITKRKWQLPSRAVHWLTLFRRLLFVILVGLMICGIWAEWMNYELFAAFAITTAHIVVVILAVVVLILSIFIPRPYCRFVCPTGTLIRMR